MTDGQWVVPCVLCVTVLIGQCKLIHHNIEQPMSE